MAYQDYLPDETEVTTYEADQRELNPETDTVQGQITGLLDAENPYMKRASARGRSYANSRGLLNSSIGGQAVEAARIDAALPIAQQDASLYTTQGLANQDATNTARATNAGAVNRASLQDTQSRTTLGTQGLQNEGALNLQRASDESAMERLNVSESGQTERTQMGIDAEAQMQDRDIAYNTWATEFSAESARNLLEMEIASNETLQAERLASQEMLTELGYDLERWQTEQDIALRETLANMDLAADDRLQFGNFFLSRSTWLNSELARISEHSSLREAEKENRIADTMAAYEDDLQLMADLYAIPITFEGSTGETNEDGTPAGDSQNLSEFLGLWFQRL